MEKRLIFHNVIFVNTKDLNAQSYAGCCSAHTFHHVMIIPSVKQYDEYEGKHDNNKKCQCYLRLLRCNATTKTYKTYHHFRHFGCRAYVRTHNICFVYISFCLMLSAFVRWRFRLDPKTRNISLVVFLFPFFNPTKLHQFMTNERA